MTPTKQQIEEARAAITQQVRAERAAATSGGGGGRTSGGQHAYLATIDALAAREGISSAEAQRRIRAEQPALFESYLRSLHNQ